LGELRRQVAESGRAETLEDLFFRLTEGDKTRTAAGDVAAAPAGVDGTSSPKE
jgi:hypothetical protein